MTALGTARHARRWSALAAGAARVELALLWIAWAALAVAGGAVVLWPGLFDLPSLLDGDTAPRLAAGMALYAFSHVLRFLRLALLIHKPSIRLRRVLQAHLLTAGLGVLLPFKLSELIRVREVGVVTGSMRTGLLAVWLERTLDAAVLGVLVLITAIGLPESLDLLTPVLVLMTAFVALTVAAITVLPTNLREAMLHLVRRPFGEGSVTALRLMRGALATLEEAPTMLRGRLPSLVLLSVLIWTAEVAVVGVAIPELDVGLSGLSTSILSLLAGISSGATALMPDSGSRLVEALADYDGPSNVDLYRACLAVPVLVAAAWAASLYLPWRGRRSPKGARV